MPKLCFYLFCLAQLICTIVSASEIKHIFLAVDESRRQLHYVNEFDSSKDWSAKLVQKCRDVTTTGSGTCIASVENGYHEYDVKSGKLIKKVKCGTKVVSAIRSKDGYTYVASARTIWKLDQSDKCVKEIPVQDKWLRMLRFNNDGNFIYSGGQDLVKEMDLSGKLLQQFSVLEHNKNAFRSFYGVQLNDGGYIATTGYGRSLIVLDKNKNLVKTIGVTGTIDREKQIKGKKADVGKDVEVQGVKLHYFGTAEVLASGNIVVTNWTGHKWDASKKAAQVLEFNQEGKIVWKWHDPKRAGSLLSLVVIK